MVYGSDGVEMWYACWGSATTFLRLDSLLSIQSLAIRLFLYKPLQTKLHLHLGLSWVKNEIKCMDNFLMLQEILPKTVAQIFARQIGQLDG